MKFLHQPVAPFIINQRFGENSACVDLKTKSKVIFCDGNNPPEGYTSVYGPSGHTGVDLKSSHGQPVYCAHTGVVISIDTNPRTGLDVRVVSGINGDTYMHIYEHLLGYQPKVGDLIETGELVGWADNTGWSSGDHLHFEVRKFINGEWLSIDPLPLMYDSYAPYVNVVKRLKSIVATLAEKVADMARRPKHRR